MALLAIISVALIVIPIVIYEDAGTVRRAPNGLPTTGNYPASIAGFSKIASLPSTVDGKIQVQL